MSGKYSNLNLGDSANTIKSPMSLLYDVPINLNLSLSFVRFENFAKGFYVYNLTSKSGLVKSGKLVY